ncbi:NAD(P)H-dependent oxidoreductase [Lichenihabitans psoromatis]|uniref:NAD(P)H-dependent oxidoreductase n=1 Tax=Lichenihabitans psoromatis TaxID=2528642 RepID=UPI0010368CFA|nr:NAD(P)H-dependent oxidoreductase [Lichenihabitans psoromatis]
MSTVLLLAHADFHTSRANRALLRGVTDVPGLEVTQIYALYPGGLIDVPVERERLLRATHLVFQFPLQWYATPALLKQWEDAVPRRGKGRNNFVAF